MKNGREKFIAMSQRVTIRVSLNSAKVNMLKERHVSSGITRKAPKALFDFQGLVLFFS